MTPRPGRRDAAVDPAPPGGQMAGTANGRKPMEGAETVWLTDWMWSLPLIAVCIVIHVIGLGLINERVVRVLQRDIDSHRYLLLFAVVIAVVALLATALHGLESVVWAFAYKVLGALPDVRSAMLYSVSAMTTYGHTSIKLEPNWQMMGALESLNGILLFGLTTAFMFAVIEKVWPLGSRQMRRAHAREPARAS
jgi:hypothetical protein